MALTATVTRDCNYINIEVFYENASSYPFTGELRITDINGDSLMDNTSITISTQYTTTNTTILVDNLSITNGLVNIEFLSSSTVVEYTYPVLIHCDIDCCLTKLTNELIDCECDCVRCASALAKAQKIFLLIKSAKYALTQIQTSLPGNTTGYLLDAHSKYIKAKEICDNSCGCDC